MMLIPDFFVYIITITLLILFMFGLLKWASKMKDKEEDKVKPQVVYCSNTKCMRNKDYTCLLPIIHLNGTELGCSHDSNKRANIGKGYQPTESNLDSENPPQGGSGIFIDNPETKEKPIISVYDQGIDELVLVNLDITDESEKFQPINVRITQKCRVDKDKS